MRIHTRLGIPIAAVTIACTAVIGAPQAGAVIICTYQVINAPNGLFIRSAPNPTAHTLDKVPNGTTGAGTNTTTNGFRGFRGGWASAAYLNKLPPPCADIS